MSQIRRWYEVVVLIQDPSSLVGPRAVVTNYRAVLRNMRVFGPQLVSASGALCLIAWFVDLLHNSSRRQVAQRRPEAHPRMRSAATVMTAVEATAARPRFDVSGPI